MEFIDEKGNLFGVVNVIDALVVLVVLAMVVAGAALFVGGGDDSTEPPEPTRYATVSYEVPLGSDAATLSTDAELSVANGGETYTVADTYQSFTPDGNAHVVASLEYRGTLSAGGGAVYGGDSMALRTDAYRVDAAVLTVNRSDGTIPTTTERVVLAVNESTTVARSIEPGMEAHIGETRVGTVTETEVGSTYGPPGTHIGAEIVVWDHEPVPSFDGEALRVGNRVTLVTDTVTIRTDIAAVGTDDVDVVSDG